MIPFNGKRNIYLDIVDFYEKLIDRKALKAGDNMPTVRELALSEGINPNTVQKAYTVMVKDGYLRNVPKVGFYVLDRSKEIARRKSLKTKLKNLLKNDGCTFEEIKSCLEELEGEYDQNSTTEQDI